MTLGSVVVASRKRGRRDAIAIGVAIGSAAAGLGATVLVEAEPASAVGDANCPHSPNPQLGNWGSTSCHYLYLAPTRGIATWWSNNALNMDSGLLGAGNHVNHALWARGDGCGASGTDFLELGLTRGFEGTSLYGYYIAWRRDGVYDAEWDGTASVDASLHSYQIESTGTSGTFRAYRDGVLQKTQTNIGDFICIAQTGLEISGYDYYGPNALVSTQNFDAKPLKYQDANLVWHDEWVPHSSHWIDWPCGTPPYCLNGVRNAPNWWASNKP